MLTTNDAGRTRARMKAKALEIRWHDTQPIFSTDFHPTPLGASWRLATAGGDKLVRLWLVHPRPSASSASTSASSSAKPLLDSSNPRVEYLATLKQHTGVVNVVRFAPIGDTLASAGDDGNILFWVPGTASSTFGDSAEDRAYEKESWRVRSMVRIQSGKEIYDLAWSPDGTCVLAGSVDHTAYIYEVSTGSLLHTIVEHSHYVQGVAWDPLGQFIATQSSDRSMHVRSLQRSATGLETHAVGKYFKMDVHHRAGGTWNTPPSSSAPIAISSSSSSTAITAKWMEKEKEREREKEKTLPRMRSVSHAASDQSNESSTSLIIPPPLMSTSSAAAAMDDPADSDIEIIEEETEPSNSMDPPAARPSNSLSRRSSTSSSAHGGVGGAGGHGSPSMASQTLSLSGVIRSPSPAPLPATHRPLEPTLASIDAIILPPPPPYASTSTPTLTATAPTPKQQQKSLVKLYGEASTTPFFRRLCWSTDGSLLLTPAGLFEDPYAGIGKIPGPTLDSPSTASKKKDSSTSTSTAAAAAAVAGPKPTVYIYSRANLGRPPVAHLPGHKSTSIGIRFCPVLWRLRRNGASSSSSTSGENDISATMSAAGATTASAGHGPEEEEGEENLLRVELSKDAVDVGLPGSSTTLSAGVRDASGAGMDANGKGKGKSIETTTENEEGKDQSIISLFDLPYRMVYAVATLDAVFLYDTQQAGPICMFGNLHYAPFTDLTWSADGQTLVISSQDGYCSIVAFDPLELGTPYLGPSPVSSPHSSAPAPSSILLTAMAVAPAAVVSAPVVVDSFSKNTIGAVPFISSSVPAASTAVSQHSHVIVVDDSSVNVASSSSSSSVPSKRTAAAAEGDDDVVIVVEDGTSTTSSVPAVKKKRAALTHVGPLGGV